MHLYSHCAFALAQVLGNVSVQHAILKTHHEYLSAFRIEGLKHPRRNRLPLSAMNPLERALSFITKTLDQWHMLFLPSQPVDATSGRHDFHEPPESGREIERIAVYGPPHFGHYFLLDVLSIVGWNIEAPIPQDFSDAFPYQMHCIRLSLL